jgi:hypothetical protein
MLMIFIHITFQVPSSNDALPITNKQKAKENVILHSTKRKMKNLIGVTYFPNIEVTQNSVNCLVKYTLK